MPVGTLGKRRLPKDAKPAFSRKKDVKKKETTGKKVPKKRATNYTARTR